MTPNPTRSEWAADAELAPDPALAALAQTHLVQCSGATTVAEASRRMRRGRCSSVVVVDPDGQPAGIWTAHDALGMDLSDPEAGRMRLDAVMTTPVYSLTPEHTAADARAAMAGRGMRHVLIQGADGAIRGVVSEVDVAAATGPAAYLRLRKVASVMAGPPLALPGDIALSAAARRMHDRHQREAVVRSPGGAEGILTEQDVLDNLADGRDDPPVVAVARLAFPTVSPGDTLLAARERLLENGVRRLAVVDGSSAVVGMVSFADLLAAGEEETAAQASAALAETQAHLEELACRQRHFEEVQELMPVGLLFADPDGRIEQANSAAERLLPTAAPGLVGRLLTEVLPADTSLRQGLERLAGGETPGWQQEVAVTADGEGVRWLEVKATPRQDPGGAVDGLSLVIDEVTERKASQRQEAEAAAEQLRQRESFVQSVLGSFPDMVFLKTTEGVYVDCNDEFGRLVGQPPDAIRGQTDYDLFDGETADFFRFYDECMLARGVGRHNEEWVHYPDGSEALLDMLKTPYRDAGGTIQGVIGIGRDITDRHRAREQLRTSEVRNRAIVNTMAEGMVLFGADGVILAANPAACDILEVSEEELLGRAAWSGAWRTLSEDGAPFPQAEHPAMVTLRTGEGVSGVTMGLERADGEVRWISVNAEPLAGESGAVATFSDITQRHQAEKALAEKEAHYRELVENQTQFVERFLPDTTVLFANQAAAAFFGTTPEAMQGRRWLEALPAEEQAIAREHLATFTPEAPIASLENSLVRADGEVRWTLWTNRAFFDDAGRVTHFQSVGIDITERKRAEQDRDRLLQILEATPDFVGMGDARLQPVYYNRAALAMLGVNAIDEVQADDIEGQHPSWAWRRLHEEAFPSARRDGLWQGETALVTAEGREIPVSQVLIAMPGDNGEISHYATIMRDLSAQKEREATLRQLTEILEASPDFISMARPDGAVLYVNEGGRRLLDLPEAPTAGASTQANWSEEEAGEWGHPDWASHKIQAEGIPAALAHGYWEGETALVDAAGRERPVSQLILAHRDDAGDTVRLSTVMRDISRHKELEARLQQRQAALRRLQEVTADPERTTENKLTGLLHLGTDYFGLAHGVLSRFEGGSCLVQQAVHREGAVAAVPDCDAAATDCAGPLAGAGATGTAQGGAEAIPAAACYPVRGMEAFLGIPIHVDGTVYGTLTFAAPEARAAFSDFEWGLLRLMGQWVSDELTREAYRQALERERDLFVAGPTVTFVWRYEPGLPVAYVSPNLAENFGHHAADLRERAFAELVHPEDRERMTREMAERIAQGAESFEQEYRLRTAAGEYRWVYDFTVPHRDGAGGVVTLHGYLLDRSGEHHLREALQTSNAELEQFAYAISHDLKEPLRSVSGYLNLTRRRFRDQLPGKAMEYVAAAEEGGERMGRMIEDLLEYSRIKRLGEAFSPVPLAEVLDEALANLKTIREETGAVISADPLPTVSGDRGQLVRVFQNLLGNALKYRRSDVAPAIGIRLKRCGGDWEIAVSDNGIGIDPAQLDRVFLVFQRLHSRSRYEGTGAGMALAQRIVQRHGGTIWAESEGEGRGTTFRFTLPRPQAAP